MAIVNSMKREKSRAKLSVLLVCNLVKSVIKIGLKYCLSSVGGTFCTTEWISSNPQLSFILDGIRRCCVTASTPAIWPFANIDETSLEMYACRSLTRPGTLPFCCQMAGVNRKGSKLRYWAGISVLCMFNIWARIWKTYGMYSTTCSI